MQLLLKAKNATLTPVRIRPKQLRFSLKISPRPMYSALVPRAFLVWGPNDLSDKRLHIANRFDATMHLYYT